MMRFIYFDTGQRRGFEPVAMTVFVVSICFYCHRLCNSARFQAHKGTSVRYKRWFCFSSGSWYRQQSFYHPRLRSIIAWGFTFGGWISMPCSAEMIYGVKVMFARIERGFWWNAITLRQSAAQRRVTFYKGCFLPVIAPNSSHITSGRRQLLLHQIFHDMLY